MVDVAQEVQTPSGSISINGSYDPRFEGVFKEFEQNFAERGEVGAGVSVTWQGTAVVDLWAVVDAAIVEAHGNVNVAAEVLMDRLDKSGAPLQTAPAVQWQ